MNALTEHQTARAEGLGSAYRNDGKHFVPKNLDNNNTDTKEEDDALSPAITAAIVECEIQRKALKVIPHNTSKSYQSAILGFDYQAREILIDLPRVLEWEVLGHELSHQHFWIQIPVGEKFAMVQAEQLERLNDCISAKIISGFETNNQRWNPRVHFDQQKGPLAKIQLSHQPNVQGHIRNLSLYGALIEFYGQDYRKTFLINRTLKSQIAFNDHFKLNLDLNVSYSAFARSPCCHTKLRVMFEQLTDVQKAQITDFIESFTLS